MTRHLRALLRGQFIRRPKAISAAVEVHQHGALAGQARRPDVQLEHVLILVAVVPVLQECLLDCRPWMEILRAVCAVDQRGIFIRPGRRRLRRQPAVFAGCVLPVGNALECEDSSIQKSPDGSVLRFGDGRTRRRAISRLLVYAGLRAVGGVSTVCQCDSHAGRGRKQQSLAAIQPDSACRVVCHRFSPLSGFRALAAQQSVNVFR